jgi:hypothetical protein
MATLRKKAAHSRPMQAGEVLPVIGGYSSG